MDSVMEKVCNEKHKAIDSRINTTEASVRENNKRISDVEEALIKLTNMVETLAKKDFFDKTLILSVFIISLVLAGVVLGPEIIGKIISGLK